MKNRILLPVVAAFLVLCVLSVGCTDRKTAENADSLADSLRKDSMAADTLGEMLEDFPVPKAIDELFDDFIFNFAANRKLQLERVKFPLVVKTNGKESLVQKKEWKMEHFFMLQEYYTLIFDNEKQKEIVKDTTVNHVIVEKIYLDKKTVKQYVFNRIKGCWMLTSIDNNAIYQNHNASFLNFYQRFASDEKFQLQSLSVPVIIYLPDPDDDFSMMTADLYPEQWVEFKPQILPKNFIYNIIYGQKYADSNQKIFVVRGIANGYETEMTFKNVKGKWKLTKLMK